MSSMPRSVSNTVFVMRMRESCDACETETLTLKPKCVGSAGACLVQIVYSHRVKQFEEDSGGDPSALLIPALFDTKVRQLVLTSSAANQSFCRLSQQANVSFITHKLL